MESRSRWILAALVVGLMGACGAALWVAGQERGDQVPELAPLSPQAALEPGAEPLAATQTGAVLEEPAADAREVAVNVISRGTFSITGGVGDSVGQPAAHVRVFIRELEGQGETPPDERAFSANTHTDQAGKFGLGVDRPGKFLVWSTQPQAWSQVAQVQLDHASPTAEVQLSLVPSSYIEGRILDADMDPVVGVDVVCFVDMERLGLELPSGTTSVEIHGRAQAKTRNDGTFRLYPVRAGGQPFVVQASKHMTVLRTQNTVNGPRAVTARELHTVEQTNVHPGMKAITLVLREPNLLAPSFRLQVTADGGGSLPDVFQGRLRRIGPEGGLYMEISQVIVLDARHQSVVQGLVEGARYQLEVYWSGSAFTHTTDPLVATPGEQLVQIAIPGQFKASIQVGKKGARLNDDLAMAVIHVSDAGVRRSAMRAAVGLGVPSVELLLTRGRYELRVYNSDRSVPRRDRVFAEKTIEMPGHDSSFTIELP
ncbi:MAG TPA: hypothetical protein EYG30_01595 [Planctomycetes bacterium]|nr:hypothetical protein [Planctomycetota bacterium]HIL50932.1 hypothetical protein [Planctomycetota bacterium]